MTGGPEEILLSTLCAAGSAPRRSPPDIASIDWQRFLSLAQQHRVVPLVWRNAKEIPGMAMPGSVTGELRQAYERNALTSLRIASHLVNIVSNLSDRGIPSVPLKGICLAARYYGDIAARHAGDIDLLIAPDAILRADEIIRTLGYVRLSNKTRVVEEGALKEDTDYRLHYTYVSRDRIAVEIHFRLHNNPDVLAVSLADIIAAGVSVEVGGAVLPVMPDPLQFVFLATHGARHEWVRLQWVCDIAQMMHQAKSGEIREWLAFASSYSLTNPVVQAMVLAERFLGAPLPQEIGRAYAQSRRIRYMVQRAEKALSGNERHEVDRPPASFNPGRRLYRMCMTDRPRYLWHEFRNGLKALSARLFRPVTSLF